MMQERLTAVADMAGRMDRLPVTALHLHALLLCALGLSFDTLEMALGSVLAAVFSSPPHLTPAQPLSLLLASVFIGAVVGATALGWWADRHGRRNVLMGVLMWLALTSLGAAASEGVGMLTLFRGLSGLALGAYPPIAIAYLTDLLPPARRGMLIFAGLSLATLGPPAGIFLVRWLDTLQPLGLEGWRWGFVAVGCGAAIVGVLFRSLPESPRWLQARGRAAEADAVCQRFERSKVVAAAQTPLPLAPGTAEPGVAADGSAISGRRRWTLVALLFLLSPWSTIAFPLLVGAVLAHKGFRLSDTLLYVGLSMFGPLLGSVLAATAIDRIERRVALALCAAAMLVCGVCFVMSDSPWALVAASALFSLSASLYIPALNVYGAELFPTQSRASSIAGAWALNRLGAAVAPFLLVPVLRETGVPAMFAVIAATLLGSLLVLLLAPAGRERRPVT